ncbi:MAG: T9SS type A sorting domain-containing protein, partial [Bacteroidales bacterium]|nr:T9SS type A sorting domain-containing protein [Bacteroidales bacterium]
VDANNVIVRYIRSRMGDTYEQEDDAFTCRETENVIIDHCSFSWGIDEVASCYLNKNFTMQWCIISESLYYSYHSKSEHGYGGIWGGANATFHHNLLAHHSSRNPRFNGARYAAQWPELVDYRNNVIYNWGFNSAYAGEPSDVDGTKARINMINNYYKYGPATRVGELQYRIVEPYSQVDAGYSYWYINGNYLYNFPDATSDNWTYGVQRVTSVQKSEMKSDTAFTNSLFETQSAEDAYLAVLEHAGVSIPFRDTIDRRIVNEVKLGIATFGGTYGANLGIIDSPDDVEGWPKLFTLPAYDDSDHDGMPDEWEDFMGFNKNNPEDRNNDHDNNGYTNLEEYLNSIVKRPDVIYPPANLTVNLIDFNTILLEWEDNTESEDGFVIERKTDNDFFIIDTLDENSVSFLDSNLAFGTQYFYRIYALKDTGRSSNSNVANITTLPEFSPPFMASNPYPQVGSKFVIPEVQLKWTTGFASDNSKLYLGTSNPPQFAAHSSSGTYKTQDLLPSTTYYWRIDEENENGITTGEVWTFTTRPFLEEQLVGSWKFESIFTCYDSSGFNNNGLYKNIPSDNFIFDGPSGRSIKFNSTNQYIEIPNSYVFDFYTNSFTIALWLKQADWVVGSAKNQQYLIKGSELYNESLNNYGKRYSLYFNNTRQSFCFEIDDNIKESYVEADIIDFAIDDWVHVAAIRNVSEKKLMLYLNGELVSTADDSTGDISENEPLFIGYNETSQVFLNASIDDLFLYNYALSKQQINDIINPDIDNVFSFKSNVDIIIYPNPASNELYIKSAFSLKDFMMIKLMDISGNILYQDEMKNTELKKIFTGSFTPGFYMIQIFSNEYLHTEKVLIIH